jgi:hypothetical protein
MKAPWALMREAETESYEYFDTNIRPLPKSPDGTTNVSARGFHDNDVDAFRHAYVSGVFTQEYSETVADVFGRLNEFWIPDLYSNSKNPRSLNMDLWNNAVGRKYGKKSRSRESLLKKLHKAIEAGELLTDLADTRNYRGARSNPERASKPIVAIKKDKNGRNELFFDIVRQQIFTLAEFLDQIAVGSYPGYVVKDIRGRPTPVSKSDKRRTNNIG